VKSQAGDQIRQYLESEPQHGDGWFTRLSTEAEHFVEGFIFSIGLKSPRTWFMLVSTCVAVFLCSPHVLDWSWDTSMSIVAVGTVFPAVFSIQAAYTNRENSLRHLHDMKATMMWLYMYLEEVEGVELAGKCNELMSQLTVDLMRMLRGCSFDGREREKTHVVYDGFRKLMSLASNAKKLEPVQYTGIMLKIEYMLMHFEAVKCIKDTSTPKGLRKFCYFLCMTTPILLAPFFANFCYDGDEVHGSGWGCAPSYFVGVLYVLITSALLTVQGELEDPFDGDGPDDIDWTMWSQSLECVPLHGEDGPEMRKNRQLKEVWHSGVTPREAGFQESDKGK